ncbi:hypothetical protein [Asticcacaulis taihuensis]|jgi:hypothetical protein|uniref:Uncharacterized protein n=1 Tax=Asticcacaulis taihuensis TaxID=260084 RepID=A0A1G4RLZ0_9CAUL|nr:hypothetical protein [Asticcacaulis taihuensis]SCW57525.1 hypothetical protein SAMN02927928_2031 [Asticcacaulis taihuensis]
MSNPIVENLETAFSLFLNGISEPGSNVLSISLSSGCLSDDTIVDPNINAPCRAVEVTDKSQHFEVSFETYVFYAIINESHGLIEPDAIFTGKKIRKYERSNLLEAVEKISCPYDIFGERPLKHFEILTENHLVNVVSYDDPQITFLPHPPHQAFKNAQIWQRA